MVLHPERTSIITVGIVKIGNNVFIGADSIVLCNTRIGDNVIIGAGSVVTKDVPSNSVYAGNPARYICSFEEYKNKHLRNRETHPVFNQHKWDEWINASNEEKEEMKKQLENILLAIFKKLQRLRGTCLCHCMRKS